MAAAGAQVGGWLRRVRSDPAYAHIAPLAVFLGLLVVLPLLAATGLTVEHPALPWYRHAPEQWIFPVQTALCLALLAFFWPRYQFKPVRGTGLAVVLGIATITVWVLPSLAYRWLGIEDPDGETWWKWAGVADRSSGGFDPTVFGEGGGAFAAAVAARFVRLVVVVPLVEEIFWRGFLMRWLVDPDRPFTSTPFGTYAPRAVALTTAAFMLAHAPVDWFGALVFGLAMAWLAVRTKSLAACVIMHAVANLALGVYVMATRNWGFW